MLLKLPLNQNVPEIRELTEGLLKKIDEKFGSDEFKAALGVRATKFTYVELVRNSYGLERELNPDKHPYIKLKLLTDHTTNVIRTSIVERTEDGGRFPKVDTQTIGEFERYFPLRANLKCMIAPVKVWIHQSAPNEAVYGLSFKVIKVMVKLPLERSLKQRAEDDDLEFMSD